MIGDRALAPSEPAWLMACGHIADMAMPSPLGELAFCSFCRRHGRQEAATTVAGEVDAHGVELLSATEVE